MYKKLKEIINVLRKQPMLILGTICLIGAWRWENSSISNNQNKIYKAWRQYSEFLHALTDVRLTQMELTLSSELYKRDSSGIFLYNLGQDYSNNIIACQALIFAGAVMNQEGLSGRGIQDELIKSKKHLAKLRDTYNIDSLRLVLNQIRKKSEVLAMEDQDEFNTYIIKLNSSFEWNKNLQTILYGIGVILLALNKGLQNINGDNEKNELNNMVKYIYNRRKK